MHVRLPFARCLALALGLALLSGVPAVHAADPPARAYRLEPRKVPDLDDGRAVLVRGKTAAGAHRFYLEHMHMMVPVVVTLRPLQPDARLDLAIGKYPWEPPVRQGRAEKGEQVSFRFSFDFFNVFNKVDFANPALAITNTSTFGNITSQFTPTNRTDGARWIQFGARVEF